MKNKRKILVLTLLTLCLGIFSMCSVQAAAKTNSFVTNSKGDVSYYNKNGKKVKGLVTVNGRKYYFTSKGIQRTGWRCVNKKYYFFRQGKGAGAYMLTSTKVNGITLKKDGSASYNKQKLRKLKVMVHASKVVDGITNNKMTKSQKLRACYNKALSFRYGDTGTFYYSRTWDVDYAERMFFRGRGNCYAFGAAFAYMANAVGYKAYAISSGGHGWAEINGKVYDPNWGKSTGKANWYYAMDYKLSGKQNRPNYKANRRYVKGI